MNKKVKDLIIRAIKTFIQGFLASLVVSINSGIEIDKSALIGALAGAISALMNYVINLLNKEEEE